MNDVKDTKGVKGGQGRSDGGNGNGQAENILLFVTGRNSLSELAVFNMQMILKNHCDKTYQLNVVDVLEQPDLADRYCVIATPCVIRPESHLGCRAIGDLSTLNVVVRALNLM